MSLKLSEDDRRALDLLLDQGLSPDANGGGRAGFAPPAFDSVRLRLRHAGDLLKLLNELPVLDPPADLVARTMARIESNVENDGSFVPSRSALFGLDQPQA